MMMTDLYIDFMNLKQWCQNKFQVTNQISVKDKYKSRYDVTIPVKIIYFNKMKFVNKK